MRKEKSEEDTKKENIQLEFFEKMKGLIYKFEELRRSDFDVKILTGSSDQYFHFTISKKIHTIKLSKEFELPFEFAWSEAEKSIDNFVSETEKIGK